MTNEDMLRTALEQIGDAIDQAMRLLELEPEDPAAMVILQNASGSAHELANDAGQQ